MFFNRSFSKRVSIMLSVMLLVGNILVNTTPHSMLSAQTQIDPSTNSTSKLDPPPPSFTLFADPAWFNPPEENPSWFNPPEEDPFNLGFESNFDGWNTYGNAYISLNEVVDTALDGGYHWEIWPNGSRMAVLRPSGDEYSFNDVVASDLHISKTGRNYFNSIFPDPVDFAYIFKDLELEENTPYQIAWNFVATDHAGKDDASFFTLTNLNNPSALPSINGTVTDVSLLGSIIEGTPGQPAKGNYTTGDFGSTGWQILEFVPSESGIHRIGFVVFNLGDDDNSPFLFVDDASSITIRDGGYFAPVGPDFYASRPPEADVTPPEIAIIDKVRISGLSVEITLLSDEEGYYYLAIVPAFTHVPFIDTKGPWDGIIYPGENKIRIDFEKASLGEDIYIVVVDEAGNASEQVRFYFEPYKLPISLQLINFPAIPNKIYGDLSFELKANALSGLPITYTSSDDTIASVNGNEVTIHKIGFVTITAEQPGNESFYAADPEHQSFKITPRLITITALPINKDFGAEDPELTYEITEGSLINNDNFTGSLVREPGEEEGTYQITQGTLALSENYLITFVPAEFTIGPKPKQEQSINFPAIPDKVYGDPSFELEATASSGLPITYSSSDDTIASVNGNEVTINKVGFVTITAEQDGDENYLAADPEHQSFKITPRSITVTALPKSKVYGNPDPELTYEITEGSLINNDNFTGSIVREPGEEEGTYQITQGTLALSENYLITFVPAEFTINPAPKLDQTITFEMPPLAFYGEGPVTLVATASSGLPVTFTVLENPQIRLIGNTIEVIATGTVVVTAIQEGNEQYNPASPIEQPFVTLQQRLQVINTVVDSKVYDGNTNAILTDYELVGVREGDDVFLTKIDSGYFTDRNAGENIEVRTNFGLNGTSSGYYILAQPTGLEANITHRPITITALPASKDYGAEDPELTYEITKGSLVNNDSFAGTIARELGEEAGTYQINQGTLALNENYLITFVPAEFTINPAPKQEQIINFPAIPNHVYGDPSFELEATASSGLPIIYSSSDASIASIKGNKVTIHKVGFVTITAEQDGDGEQNHLVAEAEHQSFTINPRPISVAAAQSGKTSGESDPRLYYEITEGSLVNKDNFTGSIAREPGEEAGTYQITQGTLTLGDNYIITFKENSFRIFDPPLPPEPPELPVDPIPPYVTPPRPPMEFAPSPHIGLDSAGDMAPYEVGRDIFDVFTAPSQGYTLPEEGAQEGSGLKKYIEEDSGDSLLEIRLDTEDLGLDYILDTFRHIERDDATDSDRQENGTVGDSPVTDPNLPDDDSATPFPDRGDLEIVERRSQIRNLVLPLEDYEIPKVRASISGDFIRILEENLFNIKLQAPKITYRIPAEEIDIHGIAAQLGLTEEILHDIDIEISILPLNEKNSPPYTTSSILGNRRIVVPPVSFNIEAKATMPDGQVRVIVIDEFGNLVLRTLELPEETDYNDVTTGVIYNSDGSISHVPTNIYQQNGKWYAQIASMTNSEYAVIYNTESVANIENHWAQEVIQNMANRLIVTETENFEPNAEITRGQFADYMVRALGLYRTDLDLVSNFVDVSQNNKYSIAIEIAQKYGIINGYSDGSFRPDKAITREEAMVIYYRAMEVTELAQTDQDRYAQYHDFNQVSSWAQPYVQGVLAAKVFNGTSATSLSPKDSFTHAQALTAIYNLLTQSKLINQ